MDIPTLLTYLYKQGLPLPKDHAEHADHCHQAHTIIAMAKTGHPKHKALIHNANKHLKEHHTP